MKRKAASDNSPIPLKRLDREHLLEVGMIQLTSLESRIFDCLSRVVADKKLSTTLRVAGGWVRDKIIGIDVGKVDIDIALDNMLGSQFARIVNEWFLQHGKQKAHVAVIAKNAEKSKHLETARMRLFDTWIDLVNLRTEKYSHFSRIPDVGIGTAEEDALRRDLTINALFYNINKRAIEDFTGRGLDDIRAGIIRTPLPPVTTLLDDPLRALRAIRFASRLNFSFDPGLYDACKSPHLHAALDTKVSRERVGTEIEGIMSSERPRHALGLLCELGLFPVVFRLPKGSRIIGNIRPPEDLPFASLGSITNLDSLWHHHLLLEKSSKDDRRIARYAALLAPLAEVQSITSGPFKLSGGKPAPVVRHIMMDELRMSSRDAMCVCNIHNSALVFRSLVHRGDLLSLDRLTVGKAVRNAGALWRIAVQVALIMDLSPAKCADTYARGVKRVPERLVEDASVIVANYKDFQDRVESMELEGVWDMKPLLGGCKVLELLQKIERGPQVGEIMRRQIDWQIQNPGKGKDACLEWLLETFKDFI